MMKQTSTMTPEALLSLENGNALHHRKTPHCLHRQKISHCLHLKKKMRRSL